MSTGLAEKCLKTVILVIWILRALDTVDDYMKCVEHLFAFEFSLLFLEMCMLGIQNHNLFICLNFG